MVPSDVGSVIPNCTPATDEPQGEDEQMRHVATSAGRRRVVVVVVGGSWPRATNVSPCAAGGANGGSPKVFGVCVRVWHRNGWERNC